MFALTIHKLAEIVSRQIEAEKDSKVKILWVRKVVAVGQDEQASHAWADVETSESHTERLSADYIVGCDGAQSIVRRSMFGENAMIGVTWYKQLVAADVRYDLYKHTAIEDSNLFVHPDRAWLAFRPSKDDSKLWRFIYRDDDFLENEDLIKPCSKTLSGLIPGQPAVEKLEIVMVNKYKIHQRIVDSMRKGRIVLASDAAHLTCPYGALGLDGGIADVGSLFDCLLAIHQGKADSSILDVYSDVRREKWKTVIDPQSRGLLGLVFSDPIEIQTKPVYEFAKSNPAAAKANSPNPLGLECDFSQHWNIST